MGRSSSTTLRAAATVSWQPALPQRQTRPSATAEVPDLTGLNDMGTSTTLHNVHAGSPSNDPSAW